MVYLYLPTLREAAKRPSTPPDARQASSSRSAAFARTYPKPSGSDDSLHPMAAVNRPC